MKIESEDFADWRLFLRLCEQHSVMAVAQKFETDPSTVSRRLSRLESRLGVKLLVRSGRGMALTSDGRYYYDAMSRLVDEYDAVTRRSLPQGSDDEEEFITISASACFQQFVISRWCLEFRYAYPNVRFDLAMSDEALDPLSTGYDIVLHSGPYVRTVENAERILLGQLTSSIAASPAYLEKYGTPQTPDDLLTGHVLMHYKGRMSGRDYRLIDREGHARVFEFTPALTAVSTVGLIRSCLAGLGVLMYAPHFMLHEEFALGKVVSLLPQWRQPYTYVTAVASPAAFRRPMVRRFLRYMYDRWPDEVGFLRTEESAGAAELRV